KPLCANDLAVAAALVAAVMDPAVAPFALERRPALAIALFGDGEADNPVGAEIAEGLPQQAPGRNRLFSFIKSQPDRPDRAAGGAAFDVFVIDAHGLFLAHGEA